MVEVSLAEPLRRSLVPGADVTRRTKVWRLSRLTSSARGDVLVGRIGFDESRITTSWDDQASDFVESDVREGTAFPFGLHLPSGRLAYQAEAHQRGSVLAAFQALLNKPEVARWRVERIVERRTWEQWQAATDRVTSLYITLRPPNPNYRGRERVGEVMEGTRASTLQVIATAPVDDIEGLDLENEFIKQAVAHVNLGYGKLTARGEADVQGDSVLREYRSDAEGGERVIEAEATDGVASSVALAEAAATVEVDPQSEAASDQDTPQ